VRAVGPYPELDIDDDIEAYLKSRFETWPAVPDKTRNLWAEA
jgi:hypothetical protein